MPARNLGSAKSKSASAKRKEQSEHAQARRDGPTRAALYEEAARKGIAGRSRMGKAELQKTLQAAK